MPYLSTYLRTLLPTLTFRKIKNAGLNYASYYYTLYTREPHVWGYPLSIGIEPTTACNLRCPHCVSGQRAFTRPTGRLQLQNYQRLLDEISPELLYLILYFQGEPYLNPHFLEMVAYAYEKKVFTLTSTNAHFLDESSARLTVESGLSHLVISMDGTNQDSYEVYRKEGSYQKVVDGIQNLIAWKRKLKSRTPIVDLQFIVFKHNEGEISTVRELGKKWGVDRIKIKSAQVYGYENDSEWIPDNETHRRYTATADGFTIKNDLPNRCKKMWQGAEITWDGQVVPCCFDKNAEHLFGNAFESGFKEVWNHSQAYRDFRKKLFLDRKSIEICKNCTEGTQGWNAF